MGLFDSAFGNPETMGLLAAAAQGLQLSGPSRTPVSTGQILGAMLGGGAQGYQGAQDRQSDQALRAMKMKQLGLGTEKDELEVKQLRDAVARNARIQARLPRVGMQSQEPQASTSPASFAPGGEMSPKVGGPDWMQAFQAQQPSQPSMQGPQRNATRAFADNLIAKANIYSEEGDDATALKMYEQATKFMPKVKSWQQVNQGGKVMFAPYYEDGTAGAPVPYEVAEKLEFRNTGKTTDAINPFTGQIVSSIKNTMSPDASASSALGWANNKVSQQRLALEQANQNQPQFNAEFGGFVSKPTVQNPNGVFTPLSGTNKPAKPLTEAQSKDNLFGTRMQEADRILTELESKGVNRPGGIKQTAEQAGRILGLGTETFGGALADTMGTATNWTQSPEQQRVDQARRDFLNAVLRKESGAAIASSEFASGEKQYFPQAGDSKENIEQKRQNRKLAIQGILSGVPSGHRNIQGGASGDWSIQRVD